MGPPGIAALAGKSLAIWLLILLLAIANGALREGMLLKALPRAPAFTLSGLILMACILLATALTIRWLGAQPAARFVAVGLFWLFLTLGFEFGFGLAVRHQDLATLLDAYRFQQGNIWPLVLVVVAVAPVLVARMLGLIARAGGS